MFAYQRFSKGLRNVCLSKVFYEKVFISKGYCLEGLLSGRVFFFKVFYEELD